MSADEFEKLLRLDRHEMRHNMNPANLRTTKIIFVALVLGPVLFFLVILFLQFGGIEFPDNPDSGNLELPMTMLPVAGLVWLATLVPAWVIPSMFLNPKKLHARLKASPPKNPVFWMVSQHRLIMIIRMAVLEGGAIVGLSVLMLGVVSRTLVEEPMLWLGAVPLAVHVLVGFLTFPTTESVVTFMEQKIVQPLRKISGA